MKKIYISRALDTDSLFWELKDEGYDIIDFSLIDIQSIKIENWPSSDWVFFYSQKAIFYYFQQHTYSKDLKYGVMSTGSANEFQKITNNDPDFIGDGNAISIAESLNRICAGKTILIPKAKHSIHSLKDKLSDKVKLETVDIYSNCKLKKFEIPACDILIFTSPMNVEAYFDKYKYSNQQIFAIGSTTAAKVESITQQKIPYCTFPSEGNLYRLVSDFLVPE